tara:strand:- start:159 stop:425 length:267 start_codon:yes stop_codon:yes gene_type:complete
MGYVEVSANWFIVLCMVVPSFTIGALIGIYCELINYRNNMQKATKKMHLMNNIIESKIQDNQAVISTLKDKVENLDMYVTATRGTNER